MNSYLHLISCLSARLNLSPLAKPSRVIVLHGSLSFHPIETSCWMIQFARHTPIYDQIFVCDCWICSHIISLSEILGRATYRTWCHHIDPFCRTFSCFLYSSLVPLWWLSSTPIPECFIDLRFGRINPQTFAAAPTSRFSWLSGASMPSPRWIWDSLSASHSSLVTLGLCKSPFQPTRFSASERL